MTLMCLLIFGSWTELTVRLATRDLRADMRVLKVMADNQAYRMQCISGESEDDQDLDSDGGLVAGYELVFIDDDEYQIQVDCTLSTLEPYVVRYGSLPFGVRAVRGAGVRYEPEGDRTLMDASVVLQQQYRSMIVGIMDGEVFSRFGSVEEWDGPHEIIPEATCSQSGYICCAGVDAQPKGEELRQVSDCPGECFSGCQQRPYVSSFTTYPVLNINAQVLEVTNQDDITFSYEVEHYEPYMGPLVLVFGDGEEVQIQNTGQQKHSYTCEERECYFLATIVLDSEEYSLRNSYSDEIEVIVNRVDN